MTRKASSILLIIVLLFSCTGCQQRVVQGDKLRVTTILKTVSSEYWKFVEAGVKQAYIDYGVDGTVVGPASEGHILDQINLIEDVFNQSPDALILAPILPSTVLSVLERFKKMKIPVLFVDTDAPWSSKAAFVGTDNWMVGKKGGEALAHMLKAGQKVVLISGALGNVTTDERIRGAKEALKNAKMNIVAQQPADCDKAKAMAAMENILQTHPDIKGVFAANDEMALGALRAIKERSSDVKVIGTDGTIEAIKSILHGELTGTVAQNSYQMGYEAVVTALKKIKKTHIAKKINSGVEVITRRNAGERLSFVKRII